MNTLNKVIYYLNHPTPAEIVGAIITGLNWHFEILRKCLKNN